MTQVEISAVQGTGRIAVRASDSVGDVRTVMVEGVQYERAWLRARIDRFIDGGASGTLP